MSDDNATPQQPDDNNEEVSDEQLESVSGGTWIITEPIFTIPEPWTTFPTKPITTDPTFPTPNNPFNS